STWIPQRSSSSSRRPTMGAATAPEEPLPAWAHLAPRRASISLPPHRPGLLLQLFTNLGRPTGLPEKCEDLTAVMRVVHDGVHHELGGVRLVHLLERAALLNGAKHGLLHGRVARVERRLQLFDALGRKPVGVVGVGHVWNLLGVLR